MTVTELSVRERLKTVIDTERNTNVVDAQWIDAVAIRPGENGTEVVLTIASGVASTEPLLKDCRDAVLALDGVGNVLTEWSPAPAAAGDAPDAGQESAAPESAAPESAEVSGDDQDLSEARVFEELKKVIDPELFVNIVDLGLIYEVTLTEGEADKKDVLINMTMTSPMCPAGPQMIANSKQVLGQISSVGNVEVKIVLDPPWTPDKMTDDARDQLGIF